jgi:hypothetical protein
VKIPLLIFFCCTVCFTALAQTDTTAPKQDTPVARQQDSVRARPDSTRPRDTTRRAPVRRDTSARVVPVQPDTTIKPDTSPTPVLNPDTIPAEFKFEGDLLPGYKPDTLPYVSRIAMFQAVLRQHPYFNFFGKPIAMQVQEKKVNGREGIFRFYKADLWKIHR